MYGISSGRDSPLRIHPVPVMFFTRILVSNLAFHLNREVDVDAQSGRYGTALRAACFGDTTTSWT
jgi:hypothetical protein